MPPQIKTFHRKAERHNMCVCTSILTVDPISICQTLPRTQSGTPLRTLFRNRVAFFPILQLSKLSIIVRHFCARLSSFDHLTLRIWNEATVTDGTETTCGTLPCHTLDANHDKVYQLRTVREYTRRTQLLSRPVGLLYCWLALFGVLSDLA